MKLTTVLVSGALALSLAQPAAAAATPRSFAVKTADLNLASPEGRATLDGRIRAAAAAVCTPLAHTLEEKLDYDRCLDGAIASAQPRKVELIAASGKNRTLARR